MEATMANNTVQALDLDLEWNRAMDEAITLSDRCQRPVQIFETYPAGYAVSMFLLNKDGTPAEAVKGQIVYPGTPRTAKQMR
jgi:hypothetical protein